MKFLLTLLPLALSPLGTLACAEYAFATCVPLNSKTSAEDRNKATIKMCAAYQAKNGGPQDNPGALVSVIDGQEPNKTDKVKACFINHCEKIDVREWGIKTSHRVCLGFNNCQVAETCRSIAGKEWDSHCWDRVPFGKGHGDWTHREKSLPVGAVPKDDQIGPVGLKSLLAPAPPPNLHVVPAVGQPAGIPPAGPPAGVPPVGQPAGRPPTNQPGGVPLTGQPGQPGNNLPNPDQNTEENTASMW